MEQPYPTPCPIPMAETRSKQSRHVPVLTNLPGMFRNLLIALPNDDERLGWLLTLIRIHCKEIFVKLILVGHRRIRLQQMLRGEPERRFEVNAERGVGRAADYLQYCTYRRFNSRCNCTNPRWECHGTVSPWGEFFQRTYGRGMCDACRHHNISRDMVLRSGRVLRW